MNLDRDEFIKTCEEANAEAFQDGDRIIVIVPNKENGELFKKYPEVVIHCAIKPNTRKILSGIITNWVQSLENKPNSLSIEFKRTHLSLKGEIPDPQKIADVWDTVCRLLDKDGYADSWEFGPYVYSKSATKALASHKLPKRTTPIDVIDEGLLHKALLYADTVEHFLQNCFPKN